MIAYGKVKTRSNGKVASHNHAGCSECCPAGKNKKKARQAGKKEVEKQLNEAENES